MNMRLAAFASLAALMTSLPVAAFAQDVPSQDTQSPPGVGQEEEVQEPESADLPTAPVNNDAPVQAPAGAPPTGAPVTGAPAPATAAVAPPAAPEEASSADFNMVRLQATNKVTARTELIDAPIGGVTRFGTIEITPHKCWRSGSNEAPENAALMDVSEIKQGEQPVHVFTGWMMSSTPGLSSLEHPSYDISVVACSKSQEK